MNNSHQLLEEALSIMKSTAQEESKNSEYENIDFEQNERLQLS